MGAVYVETQMLRPTLQFLIDTAAQTSFIRPVDEATLMACNPGMPLRESFQVGAMPVKTLLGNARFKFLKKQDTGIAFIDIHNQGVSFDLEYLYFSDDRSQSLRRWVRRICPLRECVDIAGRHIEFSILGRDVLSGYALYSCISQRYGFLTDDPALKAFLGRGDSPVGDVQTFFDDNVWSG